jgi:hypothetical protein
MLDIYIYIYMAYKMQIMNITSIIKTYDTFRLCPMLADTRHKSKGTQLNIKLISWTNFIIN